MKMAEKRRLTRQELTQLQAVDRLPDDRIDTDDPEAPEILDWSLAERGKFYRPVKRQTTIRLDADILEWFRNHPLDRGYQTHINAALREYVLRKQGR